MLIPVRTSLTDREKERHLSDSCLSAIGKTAASKHTNYIMTVRTLARKLGHYSFHYYTTTSPLHHHSIAQHDRVVLMERTVGMSQGRPGRAGLQLVGLLYGGYIFHDQGYVSKNMKAHVHVPSFVAVAMQSHVYSFSFITVLLLHQFYSSRGGTGPHYRIFRLAEIASFRNNVF